MSMRCMRTGGGTSSSALSAPPAQNRIKNQNALNFISFSALENTESKPAAKLFCCFDDTHIDDISVHVRASFLAFIHVTCMMAGPSNGADGGGSSDRFVDDVGVGPANVPANKCSVTSGSRTMSGSAIASTPSSSRHRSSCHVCTPCTEEHFISTTKSRMTDKVDSLCELDRCPSPASCGSAYHSMKGDRIRERWRRKLVARKHQSPCSVVIIVGASVVVAAAIGLCAMATTLEHTPSTINILWQKNLERIRRWDNIDISEQTPSRRTSTLNFPRSDNGLPGQEPSLGSKQIRNGDDMPNLQLADLSELDGDELGASMSKDDSIIHRDQPEASASAIQISRDDRAPVASGGTSIAAGRYATSSKLPRIRRRSLKSSKSSKGSHSKYRQSKKSKGSSSSSISRSHGNMSRGYGNQRRRPSPSESSDSKSSRSSSTSSTSGEDGSWRTTLDNLRARADETEGTDERAAASTEEEDFYQFFLMDGDDLSSMPTYSPTSEPTPTYSPTVEPTEEPSDSNTEPPTSTSIPTVATDEPTISMQPTTSTSEPTTLSPTFDPTLDPTGRLVSLPRRTCFD